MAAIAMAESGGNPYAHNSNAATGDDSYGLWQINYYGSLRASRTARYGPPESLYDPVKNAKVALDLLGSSGSGITNWSTFNSGAYRKYLPPSVANSTRIAGSPRAGGNAPGLPILPGVITLTPGATKSVDSATGAVTNAVLSPLHGLEKDILYGMAFLGGLLLIITGLILVGADLGIAILGRTKAARSTQKIVVAVRGRRGDEFDQAGREHASNLRAESLRQARHPVQRQSKSEEPKRKSVPGPNQRRMTRKEEIPF